MAPPKKTLKKLINADEILRKTVSAEEGRNYRLNILAGVRDEVFPDVKDGDKLFIMVDKMGGKSYRVVLNIRDGKTKLRLQAEGWKKFAHEKGVKAGDSIIFYKGDSPNSFNVVVEKQLLDRAPPQQLPAYDHAAVGHGSIESEQEEEGLSLELALGPPGDVNSSAMAVRFLELLKPGLEKKPPVAVPFMGTWAENETLGLATGRNPAAALPKGALGLRVLLASYPGNQVQGPPGNLNHSAKAAKIPELLKPKPNPAVASLLGSDPRGPGFMSSPARFDDELLPLVLVDPQAKARDEMLKAAENGFVLEPSGQPPSLLVQTAGIGPGFSAGFNGSPPFLEPAEPLQAMPSGPPASKVLQKPPNRGPAG